MELPLEILASFLLGYAVQQASQVADRVGWPVTVVLIANLIRMAHGSAQIRSNELRPVYDSQVQARIRIFWKTGGDLVAAVIALMLTFVAVEKLGGDGPTAVANSPYSFCAVGSSGWKLPLPEHECLTLWMFLPYLAYMPWDVVIFVATFDTAGPIGSLWHKHNYRTFAIVWIATHVVVLTCFVFLSHFVNGPFGVEVCYVVLGTAIILVDYTFNRGFYFPTHFTLEP